MNILEIHGQSSLFGGASIHTSMLVEYFSKKEGETVLVYQNGNEMLKNAQFPPHVRVYEFDLSNLILLPITIWRIYKLVKRHRIDIIHSHHRKADFVAGIIRFFNRQVRALTTIHGRFNEGEDEYKLKYRVFNYVTVYIMNALLDEFVFISEYTMRVNEDYFRQAKRKSVIYNGSLRLKSTKSCIQTRQELGIDERAFVVALLGAMGGRKRAEMLLQIALHLKDHKDICYLFVGDGEQIPALREKAEQKGINALFPGYRKDVGDIILASNIIVSTAAHEGFGRTLTEAMMLSKPVIAFNTAGPAEIIKDGEWGYLIEEGDIEGFANAIHLIYSDKTLEKRLGENAAKVAEEKFSNEVFCENYEKTFQELVSDM